MYSLTVFKFVGSTRDCGSTYFRWFLKLGWWLWFWRISLWIFDLSLVHNWLILLLLWLCEVEGKQKRGCEMSSCVFALLESCTWGWVNAIVFRCCQVWNHNCHDYIPNITCWRRKTYSRAAVWKMLFWQVQNEATRESIQMMTTITTEQPQTPIQDTLDPLSNSPSCSCCCPGLVFALFRTVKVKCLRSNHLISWLYAWAFVVVDSADKHAFLKIWILQVIITLALFGLNTEETSELLKAKWAAAPGRHSVNEDYLMFVGLMNCAPKTDWWRGNQQEQQDLGINSERYWLAC